MASEDDVSPELLHRLQRSCSIKRSNSTPECTCDVVCDGSCRRPRLDNDVSGSDDEDDDLATSDDDGVDVDAPRTDVNDECKPSIDDDDECKPPPTSTPLPPLHAAPAFVPSPPSPVKPRSRSHPPQIIEYLWHGEALGLEICRSKMRHSGAPYSQPRITLRWKQGPIGMTFGIEKATRQVYIKRVQREYGNIHAGFLLVFANGAVVSERNFDVIMQDLKRNHDLGREQTLEFVPPPSPPMARLLSTESPLARIGVTHHYELMLVGETRALYLTLPEIQQLLQTSPRPTRLSFCFNPAAHDVMVATHQRAPEKAGPIAFDNRAIAAAAFAAVICL
ncbi:hypothetical protein SPRG_00021 [Saprolegnia parasitica CBS 223.65]|uniref:PDZ domain-containing protein n=1 Tax=Saprolegnia parasitica (strain CBS 223.65) TaxID=695850 RepID=A0A067D136_SAPPC|nr:hypothetical protein SPRG_00021 [Saprolegnia parasitica CBS 223.65]KDO35175.1 hypothetical protein SPRG_00021 [Saprolegnia parasitica CBS 223.65]|eukprot:XP_012193527.1 hypothetical protein SPRG_00021 [Saprolegnia parasitica CBS 223.65]